MKNSGLVREDGAWRPVLATAELMADTTVRNLRLIWGIPAGLVF